MRYDARHAWSQISFDLLHSPLRKTWELRLAGRNELRIFGRCRFRYPASSYLNCIQIAASRTGSNSTSTTFTCLSSDTMNQKESLFDMFVLEVRTGDELHTMSTAAKPRGGSIKTCCVATVSFDINTLMVDFVYVECCVGKR